MARLVAIPGGGPAAGAFARLEPAAAYLGLTEAALRSELATMTLADVARSRGRPVSGLVDVLLAPARSLCADAMAEGRMTRASGDAALARAEERMQALVNRRANFFERGSFVARGSSARPPAYDPAA